jgi:acetoin utilization deacetylase AcuC-like enzyme
MTVALFTHDACQRHDPGPGHPESPARLAAVLAALRAETFAWLDRREAPLATQEDIARVHDPDYVRATLAAVPETGYRALDPDTILSTGSGEAALRAAGAAIAAVDAVMMAEVNAAFCAVRPPGHHAEHARAMGFCLFNNVVIAADRARRNHGVERVAVMDFDVHHGNGTQALFWDDPNLMYASTHQANAYPGTGLVGETGAHDNIVNVPLRAGAGSGPFRDAMIEHMVPALTAFHPDLLIISAGFDAHRRDPLANLNFETEDFAWATRSLVGVAESCCDGRMVSMLEGGYDLEALGASAAAHVRALME